MGGAHADNRRCAQGFTSEHLILDGELVALDKTGKPSFYELPNELKVRVKARLVFYAFDLLYLDGFDLRRAPLMGRKRVLAELLSGDGLNTAARRHRSASLHRASLSHQAS